MWLFGGKEKVKTTQPAERQISIRQRRDGDGNFDDGDEGVTLATTTTTGNLAVANGFANNNNNGRLPTKSVRFNFGGNRQEEITENGEEQDEESSESEDENNDKNNDSESSSSSALVEEGQEDEEEEYTNTKSRDNDKTENIDLKTWSSVRSPGFTSRIIHEERGGRDESAFLRAFAGDERSNSSSSGRPSSSSFLRLSQVPTTLNSRWRFPSPSRTPFHAQGYSRFSKRDTGDGTIFVKLAPLGGKGPPVTPITPNSNLSGGGSSNHSHSHNQYQDLSGDSFTGGLGGIPASGLSQRINRLWKPPVMNTTMPIPRTPHPQGITNPNNNVMEALSNRKRGRDLDRVASSPMQNAETNTVVKPLALTRPGPSSPSQPGSSSPGKGGEDKYPKRGRYITQDMSPFPRGNLQGRDRDRPLAFDDFLLGGDYSSSGKSILEQMNQTEKRFFPDLIDNNNEATSNKRGKLDVSPIKGGSSSAASGQSLITSTPMPAPGGNSLRKRIRDSGGGGTASGYSILEEEEESAGGREAKSAKRFCHCNDCYQEAAGHQGSHAHGRSFSLSAMDESSIAMNNTTLPSGYPYQQSGMKFRKVEDKGTGTDESGLEEVVVRKISVPSTSRITREMYDEDKGKRLERLKRLLGLRPGSRSGKVFPAAPIITTTFTATTPSYDAMDGRQATTTATATATIVTTAEITVPLVVPVSSNPNLPTVAVAPTPTPTAEVAGAPQPSVHFGDIGGRSAPPPFQGFGTPSLTTTSALPPASTGFSFPATTTATPVISTPATTSSGLQSSTANTSTGFNFGGGNAASTFGGSSTQSPAFGGASSTQPPASGAAQQPPASGAAQQPPASGAAQQPPASGAAQQPPASGAAQQPQQQNPSSGNAPANTGFNFSATAPPPFQGVGTPSLTTTSALPPASTGFSFPATPTTTATPAISTPATTSSGLQSSTANTSTGFNFGGGNAASTFGGSSTQSPAFGGTSSTQPPAFGGASSTQPPAFRGTSSTQPPAFGAAQQPQQQQQNPFSGNAPANTGFNFSATAPPPFQGFGTPSLTTSALPPASTGFSFPATTTTTATPAISTPATTSFGLQSSTANTSTGFNFGGGNAASTFGGSSTQPPAFGGTSSTQPPAFGGASSTQPPAFGGTSSTQPPAFGGASSTQPPAFGGTSSTQPPVFRAAQQPQQQNPFSGNAPANTGFNFSTTAPPPFQGFGTPSLTTTSALPPASTGFSFPATTTATPVISTPATTSSGLQSSTANTSTGFNFGGGNAASTFGGSSTQSPAFGGTSSTQPPAFGGASSTQPPAFGGTSSQPPAFGAAQQPQQQQQNPFGGNAPANTGFNFSATAASPSAQGGFNFSSSASTNPPNFAFGQQQQQLQQQGTVPQGPPSYGDPNANMFSIGSGSSTPRSRRTAHRRR